MRALLKLYSSLLIGLAPAGALAATLDACGPVDDPQQLARKARLILVGEMHGTREFPALVAKLACQALEAGRPVTLGLEMPLEEEARLAPYLTSSGDGRATKALTEGSWFWHKLRDGRSSAAMLALIEQARRWRAQGKPVQLIAIDKPHAAPGTRDEHMAARVRQALLAGPGGMVIALTGNLHNRLLPFAAKDMHGHKHMRIDTPMGVLLRDLEPVSIGSQRTRGAFFACMPDCRVHSIGDGGPALAVPRIAAAPDGEQAAYTHLVDLGPTTASAPALDSSG